MKISKTWIIVAVVVIVLIFIASSISGIYNRLVTKEETVNQVQNLDEAIHHGNREAEKGLSPGPERRLRRVRNHVESEQDERGAGHGR